MSTVARVPGWDGLRGLCALAVMAYHLLYWQDLTLVPTLGTYGVYLFFILSGASLAYAYDGKQIASVRGSAAFLALRWLRLAPLYLVVCALFVVMLAVRQGQWPQDTARLMLLNASFLFGLFTPATSALAIGGWSLGIEFVFYLALPWVLRALPHVRLRVVILAVLIAIQWAWVQRTVGAQGLAASTHAYHQVPAFAAYFYAGCLIGHARKSGPADLPLIACLCVWLMLAVLLLAGAPAVSGDELVGWRGLVLPVACVVVVWASGRVSASGRGQAMAAWLGDITYGTYLLHPMLFFGFAWFVLPAWTAVPIDQLPAGIRWTLVLVVVLLSCALARASERWFERPVRAAGRRLLAAGLTRRSRQSESASMAS